MVYGIGTLGAFHLRAQACIMKINVIIVKILS